MFILSKQDHLSYLFENKSMSSFSSFVYLAKLISFTQRKIIIANPVFQSRKAKKKNA